MKTLGEMVNFEGSNPKLIQKMYLKKGEKLTKRQMLTKQDEIENLLLKVSAREIKLSIIDQNSEQIQSKQVETDSDFQDELLNELNSEDTEVMDMEQPQIDIKQNKLILWVKAAADEKQVQSITRYLYALSCECIQLEILTGNPLITIRN